MADSGQIISALKGGATEIMQYFVNFSGEFSEIEKVIIYVFAPAVGIMISAWGIVDFLKLKKSGGQGASPASIITRFVVGPITIQLSAFVRALSESIFGEREFQEAETLAASYATNAQNAADPVQAGLSAMVAFMVIVGWVAALRGMIAFARMGSPQENGYELFSTGAARLIAATFLCMFQFVADDLIASVGGGAKQFSSALGL